MCQTRRWLPKSAPPLQAQLLQVRKIWDQAPHNAFTDLIRFRDRWWCTFREGQGHVSPDGAVRLISSADGQSWTSAARLESAEADLRDPKLSRTPNGQLMITAAAAWHQPNPASHQTMAWFSTDGVDWSDPVPIGDPGMWLWRTTWSQGVAYNVGYSCQQDHFVRLYRSQDGRRFDVWVDRLFTDGYPNETSLRFADDGRAWCLLRRDGIPARQLGTATEPYTHWQWKDLGIQIGGPHWIRIPTGQHVAAVRLYDGRVRTSLCWLDLEQGSLRELLTLPSGGDSSYAGLVWHEGLLWVSYYSSHEGKTSIYLAQVRFAKPLIPTLSGGTGERHGLAAPIRLPSRRPTKNLKALRWAKLCGVAVGRSVSDPAAAPVWSPESVRSVA